MSFSVTTEPREERQLAVIIQVDQARVESELRKAAKKVAGRYRIPGFRQGKAPYHIVVQQYGLANLYNEFVEDLGQELFQQAIVQEKIEPYAQSSLEDIQLEPLTYTLVVPLDPDVQLGDYRNDLRVEEPAPGVDEAAIDRQLEQYLDQYSTWKSVDRPSQYGDMLTVDVRSVIAATPEGDNEIVVLEETDWEVTPDQDNPMEPPGFDDNLIGLAKGQNAEFVLSWPADGQSIYKGKEATFSVTVKDVQAYEAPELNDDFAKLVGPDFETLDALKQSIRTSLEAGEKNRIENEFITSVVDAVVEMSTLNYPPVVVEDQIDSMLQDTEQRLRQIGIDNFETFLRQTNQNMEEYRERLRPEATKIARRNLILSEVVKVENLTVSDEEIEEQIKAMIGGGETEDGETSENVNALANMLRQGAGRNMIVSQVLTRKAIDRLASIARGEPQPELAAPGEQTESGEGEVSSAAAEPQAITEAGTEAEAEAGDGGMEGAAERVEE
jgi:trigger factor